MIVPYVEDTNSDILFTIKGIEMNFCRDIHGVRLYLPTIFELVGQKVLVRYMEDTDSDIIGLGFLITSSIMWISNRGHVFCVRGIRLHPTGEFSNVLMTKKRHDNRKTSDWSKSDCSVRGRYQQRYLVYYKRYRNEFLQRRTWSKTVSSDEI